MIIKELHQGHVMMHQIDARVNESAGPSMHWLISPLNLYFPIEPTKSLFSIAWVCRWLILCSLQWLLYPRSISFLFPDWRFRTKRKYSLPLLRLFLQLWSCSSSGSINRVTPFTIPWQLSILTRCNIIFFSPKLLWPEGAKVQIIAPYACRQRFTN